LEAGGPPCRFSKVYGAAKVKEHPGNSQAMKVLYCILDNRCGGPHRRAHAIALRLRRHDIETLFLLGYKAGPIWQPEGFKSFVCKHMQCFRRHFPLVSLVRFVAMLPCTLLRLCRIIRANDIDIVHVDGVTNFVPALAARLAGVPIIWHYNDHLPGPARWLLLPLATALSSTVIVQGEKLREQRTRAGTRLRDKTLVIYSGIDTTTFDPAHFDADARARFRQALGLPAACPVIGTIGNLNRYKGHTYFIQAAARVKRQATDARFVIVGAKLDTARAYWKHLQRLTAAHGLANDIVYTGFREDVRAVLSAMDVFVLSSVLESCPVVLLEAMAMGVPVVTTDVGAASELVLHSRTGFVVPTRDADAIAEAVLACLAASREQIQNMAQTARKRVEQEFALDTIARQQLQVYESVHRRRVGRA
jgi:glycosyltransferase involved in cell wall biosynthesis